MFYFMPVHCKDILVITYYINTTKYMHAYIYVCVCVCVCVCVLLGNEAVKIHVTL